MIGKSGVLSLLLMAAMAGPSFAGCLTQKDARSVVIGEFKGTSLVWEHTPDGVGTIRRITDKTLEKSYFTHVYVHPILPHQTFLRNDFELSRTFAQNLEGLDDLAAQGTWSSEFTDTWRDEGENTGHVEVEFRRHRFEKVGDCRYKVWEVLVHVTKADGDTYVNRLLYSPDLRLVLQEAQSAVGSLPVLHRGFERLRVKEE